MISPVFGAGIERLFGMLPRRWHICFLGHHSTKCKLIQDLDGIGIDAAKEMPHEYVSGTYGYLVNRDGAALLKRRIFPLEVQLDVAISKLYHPQNFAQKMLHWLLRLRRAGVQVPDGWKPEGDPLTYMSLRPLRAFALQAQAMLLWSAASQEYLDTDIQDMGKKPDVILQ